MYMLFQWIFALFLRKPRPKMSMLDVCTTSFRVLPTDIDFLMHMNNGRYLSYMDLARVDLMRRSGVQDRLHQAGMYPVVAAQTITYRKSLQLFQRFEIQTRLVGADERALFLEQRFVVNGEVYARAIVRGRILSRQGGTVLTADVGRVAEVDLMNLGVPPRIAEWSEGVALPSPRSEAPSIW